MRMPHPQGKRRVQVDDWLLVAESLQAGPDHLAEGGIGKDVGANVHILEAVVGIYNCQ